MLKKISVVLMGSIVALVIGFFFIGVFIPSVEYTTTIEIDKPRDVTWRVMRERKDWILGFKSLEQVAGSPDQVGNRTRISVVRDGNEFTFDSELKQIRPPEMAETELTNDMLVHDAIVDLSEHDGKTTVVSNEKITGSNLFYRSLFALFKSRITATSVKNFEGLKRVVESEN